MLFCLLSFITPEVLVIMLLEGSEHGLGKVIHELFSCDFLLLTSVVQVRRINEYVNLSE